MKKQCMSMLLMVSLIMFLFPQFVGAHSYVDLSSPLPDSILDESPTGVWVQFSQPIDTKLSKLRLEKEGGDVIEGDQYSVDNSSMTLRLPPLDNGAYHVYWQILSLDTHVADGSFSFTVEYKAPPESDIKSPIVIEESDEVEEEAQNKEKQQGVDQDQPNDHVKQEDEVEKQEERVYDKVNQEGQVDNKEEQANNLVNQDQSSLSKFDRLNTGLRVIDIFTVMIIGGWLFFQILLGKDRKRFIVRETSTRLERWMYLSAFIISIGTSFGHMVSRAIHLTQTTIYSPEVWETVGTLLVSTTIGTVSIIRPILFAILVALTFSSKQRIVSKSILVILLLVTFGYTGHAYHAEKIFFHTIHMLALVVWFGGLTGFVMYSFFLKKQQEPLQYIHKKLKTFSTLAVFIVIIVALSGILLSNSYLESANDLLSTEYGNILFWKTGLFMMIIVVAAFHRFVWLPRLHKLDSNKVKKEKQLKYLFWGLRFELVLVIIVLVVAGMLSTSSPPADIHGDHHYYYH